MRGNITLWFGFEGFIIDAIDANYRQEQWLFPYDVLLNIPAFNREKVEELRKESHAYHFHKDEDSNNIVSSGNIPTKYFAKPVAMPAKVELKGLLPLLDKLRGNPDKMECLGLELQMTIDRYAAEVEEDLKSFAETSPHLSQPDKDCN